MSRTDDFALNGVPLEKWDLFNFFHTFHWVHPHEYQEISIVAVLKLPRTPRVHAEVVMFLLPT